MTRYYTVSGSAGTTTIAARSVTEAKKEYRSETGRTATSARES